MLDYSAHQATLGKTVGDDFREGKITLPIVYAVRAADEAGKAFWRRTLEDQIQKKGDLKRAIGLLENAGALRATLEQARGYAAKAREALAELPRGRGQAGARRGHRVRRRKGVLSAGPALSLQAESARAIRAFRWESECSSAW